MSPRVIPVCVVGLVLAAVSTGCGREAYERRLEDSKHYFTYLDKLNQNLSPPWVGRGLKFRVPKQFQVIPPPPPPTKKSPGKKGDAKEAAQDPPAEPPRDPRQPSYADITLPGLQAAFSTQLSVSGKGHEAGYLYVLTNAELLGKKGSDEKAAQFNHDVIHVIAQAVGAPDPPSEKLATKPIPDPKLEAWAPKRTFKMVRPSFAASIEGKDYRIDVYNCKDQKNEVTLVYVLPENVSPAEKLNSNIDLSLETLQITQVTPNTGSPQAKAAASRGM